MAQDATSSPHTPSTHRSRRVWALVVALLGVQFALGYASAWNKSPVYDEPAHLFAGYTYLKTGDFRMMPSHPPLAEMLGALPLLICDVTMPDLQTPGLPTAGNWDEGAQYRLATHWLYHAGNDPDRIMRIARVPMLMLMVLGGLAIYWIAARTFSAGVGLFALALWTFSPSILAHGRWVTTDLPAAVFFVLAAYSFWRLTRCISIRNFLLAGVCISALFLTKFSAGLFVVMATVLVAVRVAQRTALPVTLGPWGAWVIEAHRRARRALCLLAASAVLGVFLFAAVWAGFGFRYQGARDEGLHYAVYGFSSVTRRTVLWMAGHHVLPEAYLYGLLYTLKSAEVRLAYLRGRISIEGWWYYFPYVFAVKTTVPLLVLIVIGAFGWLRCLRVGSPRERQGASELLWPALVVTAVYWLALLGSSLNIGHRHLLVIYPFVMIIAAGSAWWLRAGRRLAMKCLVGLLLILHAGAGLRIHPHYLAFFNVLAGGPTNGWRLLSDSNIDWGQDLIHLERYLKAHPELLAGDERLRLAYFGTADPAYYLGTIERLPSWPFMPEPDLARYTPGLYAISVTELSGLYLNDMGPWDAEHQRRWEALLSTREEMAIAGDDPQALAALVDKHRQVLATLFPPEARRSFLKEPAQYAQFFPALRDEVDRALFDLSFLRLILRLREQEPLARIGYSIYVYRVGPGDLRAGPRP
jgi:hypothetical protein